MRFPTGVTRSCFARVGAVGLAVAACGVFVASAAANPPLPPLPGSRSASESSLSSYYRWENTNLGGSIIYPAFDRSRSESSLPSLTVAKAEEELVRGTSSIPGAATTLGTSAKIFSALSNVTTVIYGYQAISELLSPLFYGSPATIDDVLAKLDQIQGQLTQIQDQLNQVQDQLTRLRSEQNLGQCSTLLANLNSTLVDLSASHDHYQQLIDDAAAIPTAKDPAQRVKTLDGNFQNFAENVLGPGVSVAASPLGRSIGLIDADLRDPGGGLGQGIIQACTKTGFDNWRSGVESDPASGWLDDWGYYRQISNLVLYYQSYEVQALNFIEEAGYFRATELLHQEDPAQQVTPALRSSVCHLAYEDAPDGSATRLCKNVAAMTRQTYRDLVEQWKLTGRPYSDSEAVLQIGSDASGFPGDIKPTLWARDPASVPDATGTWHDSALKNPVYDGLEGWKPAGLADWTQLQAGYGRAHGGATDLLDGLQASEVFTDPVATYWIPEQTNGGLTLPTNSILYQGYKIAYRPYSSLSELTMRCFVAGGSPGIGCSQDWLDHHVGSAEFDFENNGVGVVSWKVQGPDGPGMGDVTFQADTTGTQPAFSCRKQYAAAGCWVLNRYLPDGETLPGYFQPVVLGDHSLNSPGSGLIGSIPSKQPPPKTYDPPEVDQRLMPALTVPDRAECKNPIGLPKLCTSGADSELFTSWVNTTIPNPDEQGPIATGAPSVDQRPSHSYGTTTCTPAGWESTHSDQWGDLHQIDTTWTGQWSTPNADGHTTRTINLPADEPLDDRAFAVDDGFRATEPYRLTCTVNARWTKLANVGSAPSAEHEITP